MSNKELRKAAVLIASLDSQSADRLLDQMSDRQAAAIRNAIMDLRDVSDEEAHAVMSEFMGREQGKASPEDLVTDGIELDESLANAIQARRDPEPTYSPAKQTPPFRFLHQAAGDLLSEYLRNEHPQTIALVLAHLPPERASEVLVQLDGSTQADVLRRIAELGETDREVVYEVERILESHVSKHLQVIERRTAGLATVQAILNAADTSDRDSVMQNLTNHGTDIAQSIQPEDAQDTTEQLAYRRTDTGPDVGPKETVPRQTSKRSVSQRRAPPTAATGAPTLDASQTSESPENWSDVVAFEFEQLAELNVNALAKVLQRADMNLFLIALVGAPPKLTSKIMKQLPAAEAKLLRRKLEQQGPLRLRDVEIAQQSIANIASQLAARNEIPTPRAKRFAMTA